MKLHIFDFDGTLVDTDAVWDGLAESCLSALGVKPNPLDIETIAEMSLAESAAYFARKYGIATEDFRRILRRKLRAAYASAKPIPGNMANAAALHKNGAYCCVATASERALVMETLQRLGAAEYFAFVTDCDEIGCAKTNPAFYRKILERTGFKEAILYDSAFPKFAEDLHL